MSAEDDKERRRRERGLTFSPGEHVWITFVVFGSLLLLILLRD